MAKGGGRMKKWIAALCAAALCLVLVLPATHAASSLVYHMAVNDKFADGEQINPATMPILIDFSTYVASSVLDKDSTGVNLGTTAGTLTQVCAGTANIIITICGPWCATTSFLFR